MANTDAQLPAASGSADALADVAAPQGMVIDQLPAYDAPIPHETLVQWFEDSEEATIDSRSLSERDRDYVDNKQFTSAELKALEKRGQPAIIINRIKNKHQFLMGYEKSQLRLPPRGFPRTPDDESAADACSDALRYIAEKADADQRFSQTWDNMIVEGFGGVELRAVPDGKGSAKIEILQCHWDRSFYDPHSREHGFEDARYLGRVVWLDEDDAKAMYPDAAEIIARTISEDAYKTYQDRPAYRLWAAGGKRKRVRIVQMYYSFGAQKDWHWSIFTKGGVIQEGEVPYRDEDGVSQCPMIFQSAFVDRENNRYGVVRQFIGPQDEINKRRSKALHLLMNRQTRSKKGAIDDIDAMKAELSKADGHVEYNDIGDGESFGIIDTTAQLSGNVELAQEAKNEIDLMGPNAALSGKQHQAASGRAVIASQQGGEVEISDIADRQKHFKRRVYALAWTMARQYWTRETAIRVTDDENKAKFITLNRPVTLAEDLLKQATDKGIDPEEAQQRMRTRAQQDPAFAQQLGQTVRMENVPAEMGMDIILGDAPSSANIQQEDFATMAELGKAGVVQFTSEQWIELSSLHNKATLLKKIKDQQPDPAKQAAVQAQLEKTLKELEKMNAEIDNLKSTAALNYAKADQTAASTIIQTPTLLPPQGSPQTPQQAQSAPQGGQPVAPQAQPQQPQVPAIRQVYPPPRQASGF
jgi:hypothetical protein